MPAVSEKQRKFFGAELARARKGKKTRTKLPEHKLAEYASKPLAKAADGAVISAKHGAVTLGDSNALIKSGYEKAGY